MTGGGAGAGCLCSRDGPGRPPSASSPHSPPPRPSSPPPGLGSRSPAPVAASPPLLRRDRVPGSASNGPAAGSPTPRAMRAVQPGPVPSGPRVALLSPLLPPPPFLLLLLLVAAPGSAQAQAPAPDLAALCR